MDDQPRARGQVASTLSLLPAHLPSELGVSIKATAIISFLGVRVCVRACLVEVELLSACVIVHWNIFGCNSALSPIPIIPYCK